MDKTELDEIVEKLFDKYGNGRHFEVIYASRKNDGSWTLTIKEIKDEESTKEEGQ